MTGFLTALISVTIVLGVMILVHEWGHFIVAKAFGVRVDIFSIGFGPRIWGWKREPTDYRISALPLGGYVKMAGDNPLEERTGAPDEFLSKTRWQRVVIAIAGPAMNVILALLIFWGIFWLQGIPYPVYLKQPAVVAAAPAGTPVMAGDQIVEVNGVKTPTWDNVFTEAAKAKPDSELNIVVRRAGMTTPLMVHVPQQPANSNFLGYPPVEAKIDEVAPGTPAAKAGLKAGDLIVAMDGKPVKAWGQLVDQVHSSDGQTIDFLVHRDDQQFSLPIKPAQVPNPDGQLVWQIGVAPSLKELHQRQDFVASAKDAYNATIAGLSQIVVVLGGLFDGRVSMRELMGPVGIARASGEAAKRGATSLLELMAVISLNLGLLNLLPIPILDGGHVLMLAIESVLRRDLSVAFKERFVQVGLVFLLGIFAFVMYSDILRLIQAH